MNKVNTNTDDSKKLEIFQALATNMALQPEVTEDQYLQLCHKGVELSQSINPTYREHIAYELVSAGSRVNNPTPVVRDIKNLCASLELPDAHIDPYIKLPDYAVVGSIKEISYADKLWMALRKMIDEASRVRSL